jgi:DNA-binding beta-propeller fold protein YncE
MVRTHRPSRAIRCHSLRRGWLVLPIVLLVILPSLAAGGGGPRVSASSGLATGRLPTIAAPAALTAVRAPETSPAPAARGFETANGTFGSVAFSWVLANDTVDAGAVNLPYPSGPDQVLYVPANGTLWTAFASPPAGESNNVTVQNLASGATVLVDGVGNVTGWTDDVSTQQVFLTETFPGTGSGGVLAVDTASNDVVRSPTVVGADPTSVGVNPVSGAVWVTVAPALPGPGNVTVLNPETQGVRDVLPVGNGPAGIAFDASNGLAFVADTGSGNLTVLNLSTGRELGRSVGLPGEPVPNAIALDPSTGDLLVLVAPT